VKIIITDLWNQLSICMIQALECLKSWLGVVKVQADDPNDDFNTIMTIRRRGNNKGFMTL
jgi:hypothetical protein